MPQNITTTEKTAARAADLWIECLKSTKKVTKSHTKVTDMSIKQLHDDLTKLFLERKPFCIFCGDSPDPIFYSLSGFKGLSKRFPSKTYMLIYWSDGIIKMGSSC